MTHKHLTGAIVSVWRREGYGSTLDQLMTCRLFSAKPSLEPMLANSTRRLRTDSDEIWISIK